MKKILILIISILMVACGTIKPVPVETIINYKDSVVVNVVDSTVYIPVERVVDIVPAYDTLHLETSKAVAEAWVDTTLHVLRGNIENKTGVEYKYIYKDKIQWRDSLVYKEVPVEVQVEKIKHKHYWYEPILWVFALMSLFYIIIYVLKKYVR